MPKISLSEFVSVSVWRLRMALGKTQGQLASMVGVVEATLNRYENAFQLPKESILKRFEAVARKHGLPDLVFAFDCAYRMRTKSRFKKQAQYDKMLAMLKDAK